MARHYDWDRFIVPRQGGISLDASEFLRDPEDPDTWFSASDDVGPEKLSDQAHLPVVVLLGEPGMGKTNVLKDARALAEGDRRHAIWLDLDHTSSEDRLRDQLTAPQILQAGNSAPPADLLIDGLDTGLLAIRTLAFLLAGVFRQYPRAADLRVRLACRTAVWPSLLEDTLRERWGEAGVGVFELAPLRERDVALAAAAEGLDADAFLDRVRESHAGPLASRPVTLRFLLGLAKDGKPFPATRVELYRRGCERLCSEENETRRATSHHGNRSPSERLLIAARIAAVLMLANREAVWIGSEADMDSERDCSVNDLVGRARRPDGTFFEVSQQDIRETVEDTGLFWLRGAGRLHFAHQSYGEFLAAWYLQNQDLPAARKRDLLSESSTGGLAPQLYEVVAWAASLDKDLFRSVLATQPPVLLTSDVIVAEPELREALVQGVLTLADNGEWADTQWGLRQHYGKLGHPGLAEQLLPWIQDKSRFVVARRIAIEVAAACGLKCLQDTLVTLACDSTEPTALRGQAVDALREIGDLAHRSRLLPLLDLSAEEDPDDELAGDAMCALWPDAIDLSDLVAHIRPRRIPSHFGSYWRFVAIELPPSLSPRDLPEALRWARARIPVFEAADDDIRIVSAIVARALQHVDAPGVAEELAKTALPFLRQGLLPMDDFGSGDSSPLRDEGTRRRFALLLMPWLQDTDVDAYMLTPTTVHGFAILGDSDLPWLLDLAERAASATSCWTFARLIDQLRPLDHANAILEACARSDVLRRALAPLCGAVGLRSRRARAAREHIAWRRELQERHRSRLPDPPPDERIARSLTRIEQGDANAFAALTRDLAWEADGGYVHSTSVDLRRLPGWTRADPSTRARIVAAAAHYINDGTLDHDRMLNTGQPTARSAAAVEALFLLDAETAESGRTPPQPDWRRWVPVVLDRFVRVASDSEEQAWAEDLLRRAYVAAPEAVREAVRRQLDSDLEQGHWVPTARGLEPIWDTEIARILLNAAKAARGELGVFSSLFDTLVRQGSPRARDYGLECIAALPLRATDAERTTAVTIAAQLVERWTADAWPLVWSTIRRDGEFARSLVLDLAERRSEDDGWWGRLTEEQLGDLFLRIERWRRGEEALGRVGNGHRVGRVRASWDMDVLRNKLLSHLVDLGTLAAVSAVGRIAAAFPDDRWLRFRHASARESLRRMSWRPPSPSELLMLTADGSTRLVRDAPELLRLVVESLERFQARLTMGWNPIVRALWNEGESPRPKDENFFSDLVCDHLNRDLKGIAAHREVEARNRRGRGLGDRADILVTATPHGCSGAVDPINVVIEAKGCWNKALKTAMKDQLKEQYLIDERHRCGLYLVGWFKCDAWNDASDSRLRAVPRWSLDEAAAEFDAQAVGLSGDGFVLQAHVVDVSLPIK